MNKRIIAFFMLVFVTMAGSQAPSQSRCTLTDANSPSVRGLRLGMSTEQLRALFPVNTKRKETRDAADKVTRDAADKVNPVNSDQESLQFDPSIETAKDQFAGVLSVSATLYKGRVVETSIVYGGAGGGTIDEWVAKVAETFKLPGAQAWAVGPTENPNKVLKCEGIEIQADMQGGSASITIRNTAYFKSLQERTSGGDDKRREIKP